MARAFVRFQQRLNFSPQLLVTAACSVEEAHTLFRPELQSRMVELAYLLIPFRCHKRELRAVQFLVHQRRDLLQSCLVALVPSN